MSEDMIVCGKNNCRDAFKNKSISKVYITKEKEREFAEEIKAGNISYVVVDNYYLDKLTHKANHQGIALEIAPIEYLDLEQLIVKNKEVTNPLILMVDEVTDVNNIGAIIRSMDAFNINGLIINKKRNAQINASVAKVSTGAINHVDVCRVTNLSSSIKKLKDEGYWVACLDMDGDSDISYEKFDKPLVVVLGGEDKGITKIMRKNCDYSLSIPMFGSVNSLNVSNAAAILCYCKSLNYGKNIK